jgi:hypothetical protein
MILNLGIRSLRFATPQALMSVAVGDPKNENILSLVAQSFISINACPERVDELLRIFLLKNGELYAEVFLGVFAKII